MNKEQDREEEFFTATSYLLHVGRGDTGGATRVAQFLLSHWDGDSYKASLSDLLYIDRELFDSMMCVTRYLKDTGNYLYTYVTQQEIDPVIEMWGASFRVKH